jgi:protein-disulfide isomerase
VSPPARPGVARDRLRLEAEVSARRRRERRMLAILAAVLIVLIVGGGIALQAWRTSRAPSATSGASGTATPVPVVNGQPIILGKPGAPAKITLYEDFHCPHCGDFEKEFGPAISAAQAKGQAVVELYPMSFIDAGSAAAANGMACAAEAGFGQAYYLGLFANQDLQWSEAQLISLADQITGQRTPASFSECVRNSTHQAWVQSINDAAAAAGVNQTPTMYLNGKPVDISGLTVDKLNALIATAAS